MFALSRVGAPGCFVVELFAFYLLLGDWGLLKPIHSVLFWQPAHGKKSVGGQRKTFVDRLASDTGLGVGDMKTAMNDRKGWKEFVQAENRQRSTR